MKHSRFILVTFLLVLCALPTSIHAQTVGDNNPSIWGIFVATTPCSDVIRPLHNIPEDVRCDLIKWHLTLYQDARTSVPTMYKLNSEYGFYIDNRTYKTSGTHTALKGKWKISRGTKTNPDAVVYQLDPDKPDQSVSLLKLDDNLLHPLDKGENLLIGNGGWSFTLNRMNPISISPTLLPAQTPASFSTDIFSIATFQGRSPCGIAKKLNLPVSVNCQKIKWLLTLYQDPETQTPTTYQLRPTFHRQSVIEGKWAIIRGTKTNPDAVVYQLDPDKPQESLFLFKGDNNVLFFLDREKNLLVGNADFSYTLNRVERKSEN